MTFVLRVDFRQHARISRRLSPGATDWDSWLRGALKSLRSVLARLRGFACGKLDFAVFAGRRYLNWLTRGSETTPKKPVVKTN